MNEADVYTSPLYHPFMASVPIFVHAGSAESFCGFIHDFSTVMEQIEANRICLYAQPRALHDLLLTYRLFKPTVEFGASLVAASYFVNDEEWKIT